MKLEDFKNENYNEDNSSNEPYMGFSQELDFEINSSESRTEKADSIVEFDLPKNQSSAIKVIGVGAEGSNAVNYMFEQGIQGVDFVICNTDAQAMDNSLIPNQIQLGVKLTEGLGAGEDPEVEKIQH